MAATSIMEAEPIMLRIEMAEKRFKLYSHTRGRKAHFGKYDQETFKAAHPRGEKGAPLLARGRGAPGVCFRQAFRRP